MPAKQTALRVLAAIAMLGGAIVLCWLSLQTRAGKNILFCPQFYFTGLYCPGCGTMRALSCLLSGELLAALACNPVSAVLLPVIAVLGLWWLIGFVLTGRDVVLWRIPAPVYIIILAALLVFGILRNIPIAAFDWMRPPTGGV